MAANDRPALPDADRFTYSCGTSRQLWFPNAFNFANPLGRDKRPMEFGLFSNNRRPDRPIGEAWDEDIFEAEVADRLAFTRSGFRAPEARPSSSFARPPGVPSASG
jgi:hypothetical protein